MSDPLKIYLEPESCACQYDGRQWCEDNIGSDHPETGESVPWIEYVRADELSRLRAENAAQRRIIAATHKRAVVHENCEELHCPICEGGLFICADCGAAEIEAEERVCTGPEAQLIRLRAENERLREALRDLLSWFPDRPTPPQWVLKAGEYRADDAVDAARKALEGWRRRRKLQTEGCWSRLTEEAQTKTKFALRNTLQPPSDH